MLYPAYNFKELEPQILDYWKLQKIVPKLRKKNQAGTPFYFLDGPPYTSGKFHLGHAWNYALKDLAIRYKRSRGFKVWDRNGFDVHGLPTEHKVMDKYGLKTKEDIQKFGVDKFIKECQNFCLEMADVMTKDLLRMGITLDTSNPYMALKTEFMEGEWALIKKAYEDNHLYYGEKVLTWCEHCETAIAKHECEYQTVTDKSIFVKFPLQGKAGEFLILWTTTPWTIPYNLAVMAGPDIDYVKVRVENETWIVAKALAGVLVQGLLGKTMKVMEEFKGTSLEGLEYTHPFEKYLPYYAALKKKHPKVHTVILSEQYVDTSAGSGLVHAAPGCGPEDQEACKPYDIPPFNSLTEDGYFPTEMGKFSGWRAKVDDQKFTEALQQERVILAITPVEHEYPHCWRCHQPVIFRITFQWFFKIEDLKERILSGNKEVYWIPDTANNAYESWIRNLKDNAISRQRYWGTPLPIWKCKSCSAVKVIGSRKDLEALGVKPPRNLHLPWIDKIKLPCSCGTMMKRVPDVIDVWVDAGTASWNCLDNDAQKMAELFPADLILEAKEQTRLWFSMLSICSYLYTGQNSFKNVYVYGMLNDLDGRKMSKSLGNIISPYELIDKHGVDVLRYYMCQTNAGQDINFSWEEAATKAKNLNIFWNIHKFLITLAQEHHLNPYRSDAALMHQLMDVEEKYIVSKLHSTMKTVTELFEAYRLDETIQPLEELFLELSRTYIQMIREKSSLGEQQDKEVCVYTIGYVLLEGLKMFGLIAPFISEAMYLNLKAEFKLKPESLSHYSWPEYDPTEINKTLEANLERVQQVIQAGLNAREKARLGLRWPVKEICLVSTNAEIVTAVESLREIVANQTNAKTITILESLPGLTITLKPNPGKIGPVYGELSPRIIGALAAHQPQEILAGLERDNKYTLTITGKEIILQREMFTIERKVPSLYVESELKNALVYLNIERSEALETEGYTREIMRNIQQLRKQAGLEKRDRIIVFLKASAEMKPRLERFIKEIQEKVGAGKIELAVVDPVRSHAHQEEFMVKKEKFTVWFDKQ